MVARRRVMMTGTPLQNDLGELQNLLHFLLPNIFSSETVENARDVLKVGSLGFAARVSSGIGRGRACASTLALDQMGNPPLHDKKIGHRTRARLLS